MKIVLALLLATALALLLMRHENNALKRALAAAGHTTAAQKQNLNRLSAERDALNHQLEQNNRLQSEWRQQLATAEDASVRREQTIARLLNENEAVRRWYASALPDAVRRMHQRPACASAGRCIQPLPAGGAVPDAGKPSAH